MEEKFPNQRLLILALVFCTLALSAAYGQYTYSEIESGSGTVWGASVTELDYEGYYYGASVYGNLYDPNGNVLDSGADTEDWYAEVDLEASTSVAGYYEEAGWHWAFYVPVDGWEYLGDSSGWAYVYPPGGGPPQISFISPQSAPYGEDGYIEIFGTNFDPENCACVGWISFGTFESASDTQINIYYSGSVPVNSYAIQMETQNGMYSNTATFTITGDPTPTISSVSPQTWTDGTTISVNILGSGFGTSPTLAFSCCGVDGYSITSASDTSIYANVTVDGNAPANTVTLTVTSNGYDGFGFLPQNPGQSNQGSTQAQVLGRPILTCTPAVTRGATASCSVANASPGSISWQFQGVQGPPVTAQTRALTWNGPMVVSGTVTATVAGYSGGPLQATITVTARNWHMAPAAPVEVPNGSFFTLATPPVPGQELGAFQEATGGQYSTGLINVGPNSGFQFVSSFTPSTTATYEISPDLENQNSTFSQYQCGNYPAVPNGFISWTNLLTQTRRHEYNSNTESHWAFYVNSLNTNNPGDGIEAVVGFPPTTTSAFQTLVGQTFNADTAQILADTSVQPYGVNYDENDNFLGAVNYGPNYTSCN